MSDGGDQRRLSAILAADMVGYTRLVEQDTDGTVAAWQAARADIIDPTIATHSGSVVKLTGDGFVAEFNSVQDAVKCAIAMPEGLKASPLDFRMGVDLGDIVDDGQDTRGGRSDGDDWRHRTEPGPQKKSSPDCSSSPARKRVKSGPRAC